MVLWGDINDRYEDEEIYENLDANFHEEDEEKDKMIMSIMRMI